MEIRGAFWWANFGFVALLIYLTIAKYLDVPITGEGIKFLVNIFGFAVLLHAIGGALIGVNIRVFGEKPFWIGFSGANFGAVCGLASARRLVLETIPWDNHFFFIVGAVGWLLGFILGIGLLSFMVDRHRKSNKNSEVEV